MNLSDSCLGIQTVAVHTDPFNVKVMVPPQSFQTDDAKGDNTQNDDCPTAEESIQAYSACFILTWQTA
jgi:hypothetical protein